MRCITSPTSHGHRGCRRSQRIESLAFSNPNRRDKHYRRRHWFTATSCNRLPSLLQHSPLPPPPSDNNQDDDDNNKEDDDGNDEDDEDDDDSNNKDDDDDNEEDKDNINKEDEDNSDDDGEDNDDEDYNDQYNYDSNGDHLHFLSEADFDEDSNDEDSDDEDFDNKDSEDEDSDKEDSDDEDSSSDNDAYNEVASLVECLHTQLSIVQRLIVVLGPHFQVSYSPIARPDFCVITTLQDCYHYWGVYCRFRLVDLPSNEQLTLLHQDCLLGGFRLGL
jgi:hypothetical protein